MPPWSDLVPGLYGCVPRPRQGDGGDGGPEGRRAGEEHQGEVVGKGGGLPGGVGPPYVGGHLHPPLLRRRPEVVRPQQHLEEGGALDAVRRREHQGGRHQGMG